MDDIAWGTDAELTDEQFYNRGEEILWIKNILETTSKGSPPTIMLVGIRGVGKTVLIKKIKKELESDYLICYTDLSATSGYQMGKLTEISIMEDLFDCWVKEFRGRKLPTAHKKLSKLLTTKNYGLREIIDVGGYPIPIPKSEDDYKKLSKFVLDLPQKAFEEHSDKISGIILIIDEFQVLKDLGERLDAFLWFLRSVIQNQKNVAYVFSGSLTSTDSIVNKIAGGEGAFGGRMLNVEITPFTQETVKNYLKEKLPSLIFKEDGFHRFYQCTKGIPYYVNTFAKLLKKDVPLGDEEVKNEFYRTLPFLAVDLINQWGRLSLQEQTIVTILIDKPLRRKEIAEKLGVTTGSLGAPFKKLQERRLIKSHEGVYTISEPILKAWLVKEHKDKGVFPFRST